MTVGPQVSVSARPHRVSLQNPSAPIPNGDGSYTQTWQDLTPFSVWASIVVAPSTQQERATQGTATTTAAYVVTLPFHPQVTEHTRVLFNGRRFNVSSVSNPDEASVESVLLCEEMK